MADINAVKELLKLVNVLVKAKKLAKSYKVYDSISGICESISA